MDNFTPWEALFGGALIGLSASVFLLATGRVAGISGIFGGLMHRQPNDVLWRAAFVGGLFLSGALARGLAPGFFDLGASRSVFVTAVAGLLVGFGTRMGNGCTSGHGICGLSRFSPRSLVSVLTFMTTGALTVYFVNHLLGGLR